MNTIPANGEGVQRRQESSGTGRVTRSRSGGK
jgi:hypothetical protein